jgi:hypothetical protein
MLYHTTKSGSQFVASQANINLWNSMLKPTEEKKKIDM